MKKFLILLMMTAFLGFTSCSDDDEEGERVLGTWILQSVEPNTLFDPQECANNSTVRVEGDNTLTANFYFQQNNCDLTSGEGTWQKTGASSYSFDFPEVGEVSGTATFPSKDRMIFTSEEGIVFTFQRQL